MVADPRAPEHGPQFNPEPIHVLRARLPRILAGPVYSIRAIQAGEIKPPSTDATHRFDFTDGRRLIISIDEEVDGLRLLHVSCSHNIAYFSEDERHRWGRLFRHGLTRKAIRAYFNDAIEHFGLLLSRRPPRPIERLLSEGKGVAHLFWRPDSIKEVRDAEYQGDTP